MVTINWTQLLPSILQVLEASRSSPQVWKLANQIFKFLSVFIISSSSHHYNIFSHRSFCLTSIHIQVSKYWNQIEII